MAKANNVAFENLRAEMARKQLTIAKMAEYIGVTRDTLGYKLSRKRAINLDEALRIARKFFPDKDVYYLFNELIPDKADYVDTGMITKHEKSANPGT